MLCRILLLMSFSHLSRPIRKVTGQTFARKFITLGRVLNYWPEIVGPDLALQAYPVGMKVRKAPSGKNGPKDSKKLEAVLEVSATSADATLIHYQKPLILERLHQMLGDRIVVDIRVVHGGPKAPTSPVKNTSRPIPSQKPCPSVAGSGMIDPELSNALNNLGRWIET